MRFEKQLDAAQGSGRDKPRRSRNFERNRSNSVGTTVPTLQVTAAVLIVRACAQPVDAIVTAV